MKKNYSILMADDDHDNHFFFQEALDKINIDCTLTSVHNGFELMEVLSKNSISNEKVHYPDIIILDVNMPVLNGALTLQKIKSHLDLKHIPVYMLSTLQSANDVKLLMNIGAQHCYTKPEQGEKLQQIIAEILINN